MELSLLYCLVSGSALSDLYKNRIFNKYLLVCAIAPFILYFAGISTDPPGMKLLRAAATMLILLPVYLAGGIGGGDVKLLTVIALFLGKQEMFLVVIFSFAIGALMGIAKIIKERSLGQTIHFAMPVLISVLLVTNSQGLMNV